MTRTLHKQAPPPKKGLAFPNLQKFVVQCNILKKNLMPQAASAHSCLAKLCATQCVRKCHVAKIGVVLPNASFYCMGEHHVVKGARGTPPYNTKMNCRKCHASETCVVLCHAKKKLQGGAPCRQSHTTAPYTSCLPNYFCLPRGT